MSQREEVWRQIKGFEGAYEVSSIGRVRSIARTVMRRNGSPQRVAGRILSTPAATNGYESCSLFRSNVGHSRCVHVLVAGAFLAPGSKDIDHQDQNKRNNRASNLRRVPKSENLYNRPQVPRSTNPARGVYFKAVCTRRPYIAVIGKKYLGSFTSLEEAKAARDTAYNSRHTKPIAA